MKSLVNYIAESKTLHQNVNIAESKTLHQNVNISERLVINQQFDEKLIINQQFDEKLIINQQFDEKLIINKNYNQYTYAPKSFKELKNIIIDRLYNVGPGTEHKPIDFNDVDVSNIDSFYNANINEGIFDATKFEYIDITDWNVSKVKDMYEMFNECYNLKSVGDLSNWDVSNVEDMSLMFNSCYNLKSVGNLSKWNVSECKNMYNMFKKSGIKNIPDWYKE